jgi:DNA polymerase-3 subunit epsilon
MTGSVPDGTPGIRFGSTNGLLEEAVALLEERPRSAESLAREVLGVKAGPPDLASDLVEALLRDHPEVRLSDGFWHLASPSTAKPIPLDRVPFTVVDVETTGGLEGQGGRIVEIAAVRVEGGELLDVFSTLVNPDMPITPWVVKLTGIADSMVRDAPRFDEICDALRERLEGRVFVAHNAPYDWRFLGSEMHRARAVLPRGPRVCTVQLARRLLPGLQRRGLDSLARYYGVEISERHRARGDAIATALLLNYMLVEADKIGVSTWGALQSWLSARPGGWKPADGGSAC